jgi:high-affinity iron transporter
LGLLLLAAVLFAAFPARADVGDPPEVEAKRLVHLLGYVAADYGGAVSAGNVTNEAEYTEQITLLEDGRRIAARLDAALPPQGTDGSPSHAAAPPSAAGIGAHVAKVRALVEAKASESDVAAAAASGKDVLTRAFRLPEAPSAAPDRMRGKAIYTERCAECHGETGRGDTAKAATLNPRPVNFLDPSIGEAMTPFRVESTVRFGINGTAMVPFTFLSDSDRWDVAFYVTGMRHAAAAAPDAPTYSLAELAIRSDAALRDDLRAAGIQEDRIDAILADLRLQAPYENRAGRTPLSLARSKLDRARVAVRQGDPIGARGHIIDAYLEGIEPAEATLRAMDPALAKDLESGFMALRGQLDAGAPEAEVRRSIDGILGQVTRAEAVIAAQAKGQSFLSTAITSAGIVLREGVEAALLIGALLSLALQAGAADKKRYVHWGWVTALGLGALTWLLSSRLISLSGARREMIEGVTALLAMVVLFYVSYSLIAKREVARWMKFLRGQVSPRRIALSLFGVSLLAAYREAFETVLFYQALLASNASTGAAMAGALAGAVLLVAIVAIYTRAGRFAPPQVFFRVSSILLYGLAVVFAGQGIAALQMAGVLPVHSLPAPSIPALGVHPTIETTAVQLLLVALALAGTWVQRGTAVPQRPHPPGTSPA